MIKLIHNKKNIKRVHVLMTIIISMIISVNYYNVLSLTVSNLTLPSSGIISTSSISDSSEIRAIFVHSASLINPNWEIIAQTASDYDIKILVVEIMGNNWANYPSEYISHATTDQLSRALNAAHTRGIKLYVSMNVMLSAYEGDGQARRVVLPDGSTMNWLCPTKQASRTLVKNLVEEIVSNYDIDGFMFDYIRYETGDMCYCEECHQKFIEDTGLDVNWPADVSGSGSYRNDFNEWRIKPITELVRDMHNWMLVIDPDLEFSAAVWRWQTGWPTYWRQWIGQDWVDWIAKGYLDWVSPMVYTYNVDGAKAIIEEMLDIAVAGPEGKIPLVPFVTVIKDFTNNIPMSTSEFTAIIDATRITGSDGWIIWRYGGPGDTSSGSPDIRDYLNALNLYPRFSLVDIKTSQNDGDVTITWGTNIEATSKVEYGTSPFFNASFIYDSRVNFNYWDIEHANGNIIYDDTLTNNHVININNLDSGKYYFRVQSEDQYKILTSKIYSFIIP